jgi:cell division protein FtsZ
MIRHIQNRNNGYSKPSIFNGNNYSSLQPSHMATDGATALDMNTFSHQEQNQEMEMASNFQEEIHQTIDENLQTKIKEEANHDHSEINMRDNSLFSQEDPIEFVEESFEKVESETQLFTSDEEINNSAPSNEMSNTESSEELINENFSELNSEDKNDLEIPAFLRRQTN